MNNTTKIPAPLESIASGGEVASASTIKDHIRDKSQQELNTEFLEGVEEAHEAVEEARELNEFTQEKLDNFQEAIAHIAITGQASDATDVLLHQQISDFTAANVQQFMEEIVSRKVYLTEEEYEELKEAGELQDNVEYNIYEEE